MKKILITLFAFTTFLTVSSCRETAAPETLEDSEAATEETTEEVDLGNYDDESTKEER